VDVCSHTKGHISCFVASSDPDDKPAVFTGDTLVYFLLHISLNVIVNCHHSSHLPHFCVNNAGNCLGLENRL